MYLCRRSRRNVDLSSSSRKLLLPGSIMVPWIHLAGTRPQFVAQPLTAPLTCYKWRLTRNQWSQVSYPLPVWAHEELLWGFNGAILICCKLCQWERGWLSLPIWYNSELIHSKLMLWCLLYILQSLVTQTWLVQCYRRNFRHGWNHTNFLLHQSKSETVRLSSMMICETIQRQTLYSQTVGPLGLWDCLGKIDSRPS